MDSLVGDWWNDIAEEAPVRGYIAEFSPPAPVFYTPGSGIAFYQIAPNPFNSRTSLSVSLRRVERVAVSVYDLNGRRVTTLASRNFTPGTHTLTWDGQDWHGRAMASGPYLIRLSTESGVKARKVMLVR